MVSAAANYFGDANHAWDAFGEFLMEEYRLQAQHSTDSHDPPHLTNIINAAYTDFYEEVAWELAGETDKDNHPDLETMKHVYAELLDQSIAAGPDATHPIKRILRSHVTKWFELHQIFYKDEDGYHHPPITEVW